MLDPYRLVVAPQASNKNNNRLPIDNLDSTDRTMMKNNEEDFVYEKEEKTVNYYSSDGSEFTSIDTNTKNYENRKRCLPLSTSTEFILPTLMTIKTTACNTINIENDANYDDGKDSDESNCEEEAGKDPYGDSYDDNWSFYSYDTIVSVASMGSIINSLTNEKLMPQRKSEWEEIQQSSICIDACFSHCTTTDTNSDDAKGFSVSLSSTSSKKSAKTMTTKFTTETNNIVTEDDNYSEYDEIYEDDDDDYGDDNQDKDGEDDWIENDAELGDDEYIAHDEDEEEDWSKNSDGRSVSDILTITLSSYHISTSPVTPDVAVSQLQPKNNVPRCTICNVDDAVKFCRPNGCGFCNECFNVYAIAAFEDMGSFCREVRSSSSTEVSTIGVLPCPYFERNGCTCSSMPIRSLDWTVEAFEAFQRAERRIGVSEATAAYNLQQDVQTIKEQTFDLDGLMLQAVQTILSIGASVSCPDCGYRGEKDEGCMHITCENCRCAWCYCCGRRRHNGRNLCTTCDSDGSFIEHHYGWRNLRVEKSESAGYGALHEFHRKRMTYFLRKLVEGVPYLPWEDFWTRNKGVLSQVPTPKRRICLYDIPNAVPPCFRPTDVCNLQWIDEAQPIIDTLWEQSRRHAGGFECKGQSRNRQAARRWLRPRIQFMRWRFR